MSSILKEANKKEIIEEFYNVEEILDKKTVGRTHHYLVKWEGYSRKYATWEPKRHLLRVRRMVLEFEKKYKELNLDKGEESNHTNKRTIKKSKKLKNKKKQLKNRTIFDEKEEERENTEECLEFDNEENFPKQILSAYLNKENKILFVVEYKNNTKKNIPHEIMRKHYPDILCDFYESKIRILTKNKEFDKNLDE